MRLPGQPQLSLGKNLFILAYLGVQLFLPLRAFFYDKLETRGDFSWNMYSQRYQCQAVYSLITPDGTTHPMRHEKAFRRSDRSYAVLHRDRLPAFHAWLCEEARRKGALGSIRATVRCSVNIERGVDLIEPDVDLCTAPNYGVKLP